MCSVDALWTQLFLQCCAPTLTPLSSTCYDYSDRLMFGWILEIES